MKILAPISSAGETESLIEAGAGELYCGLMTKGWQDDYTNAISSNRRSYIKANLADLNALKKIVRTASRRGAETIIALNAFYSKAQYPLLLGLVKDTLSLGISGFIVGDLNFIKLLHQKFPKAAIYISVLNNVFNSRGVRLLQSMGVKRITLPQYMSLGEIRNIILKNPDMEFEVFIRNAGCRYVQGFCEFSHGLEEFMQKKPEIVYNASPCFWEDYRVSIVGGSIGTLPGIAKKVGLLYKHPCLPYLEACAACNLWDFKQMGIQAFKIAGRELPKETRIRDITFIKGMISALEKNNFTRKRFYSFARDHFKKTYGFSCNSQLCYYEK
ncbi:MAG: U32 family peptidase [Candidatus Omnitrophota bacterium]